MRCLLSSLCLASVLGCAGSASLVQTPDPRCGEPCYTGPLDAGVCRLGRWSCNTESQVTSCEGWLSGSDCVEARAVEACDRAAGGCPCSAGATRSCYDGPIGTAGVGICHAGAQVCGPDGTWGGCAGEQTPQPETCNCLDDDCDGTIDDIPADQYCYDGPPDTAGVGACHPGVLACSGAPSCAPVCQGEQLPEPGACPGTDGACGGEVSGPIDFVFVLDDTDTSCAGGMGVPELIQAQQTLQTVALQHPQATYRYGVVVMPGCGGAWVPGPSDGGFTLEVPLEGEQAFLPAASVQCAVNAADDPACAVSPFYSYDVLLAQAEGSIIPWDTASQQRYLILFTGASGTSREGVTAGDVQQALVENGVTPIFFAGNGRRADYDTCVAGTPGADFDLGDLPHMLAEIQLSLASCGADGG
jgi:hypothetical protein